MYDTRFEQLRLTIECPVSLTQTRVKFSSGLGKGAVLFAQFFVLFSSCFAQLMTCTLDLQTRLSERRSRAHSVDGVHMPTSRQI